MQKILKNICRNYLIVNGNTLSSLPSINTYTCARAHTQKYIYIYRRFLKLHADLFLRDIKKRF
jgi:hypothetical protein